MADQGDRAADRGGGARDRGGDAAARSEPPAGLGVPGFPETAYPALLRSAAAAARAGQRGQVRLVAVELGLMLLGAALGSAAAFDVRLSPVLPVLGAISFLAAAVLKVVGRERRYDQQWLDGRTVAETVRSASWRYMMRVPPYDEANADSVFVEALRTALEARPELPAAMTTMDAATPQISEAMRAERGRRLAERLARYRAGRIEEQLAWYARRARSHRRRASQAFWIALVAQLAALGVAGAGLVDPGLTRFNLLGLLAAAATAVTAISQLNRNDELSRTYGLAAQELSLIDTAAGAVETQAALATLVNDAEGAITREHSLWVNRGATHR